MDPYAGNNTGAIVGNESAPFAEQRYVHGGSQALVMGYDNAGALLVSTTERQFESPMDLTAGGIMVRSEAVVPGSGRQRGQSRT